MQHATQTNGTLLDDEWGEFLAANDFLVGLSMDGPAELHDVYRVNKAGRGTYDKVRAAGTCCAATRWRPTTCAR